jgi:hypothetical protein
MKRQCIILAAVLLLALVAGPGAQTTTYLVSGKVSSVSDPLSGATVEAFASGTNLPAGSASTDANGAYGMQLPAGTYDFIVTPPGGSGLSSARSRETAVTRPTTIDFVLVASGGARLSGRVLDAANTGVGGKFISLSGSVQASMHTAEDGSYALDVPPGTYTLGVFGAQSREDSVEPATYSVQIANLVLQDSVTLDFVPPVKRVTVVVKDGAGNPVPGVRIATSGPTTCEFTIAGLPACGSSSYPPDGWRKAETDASGQAILWLLPTQPGVVDYNAYQITAIPPASSGLGTTVIGNIDVTNERAVEITMVQAVVFQGRVTDADNAGVEGKYVILEGALSFQTMSAADGSYALSVPQGVYGLVFHGHRVRPEAAEPMYYLVRTARTLDLQASRNADLAPPVKAVTVIVRDTRGNPVPDVEISTDGPETCELTILDLPSCGRSSYYSFAGVAHRTNAAGEATLWLFPTQPGVTGANAYRILAAPPASSGLATTTIGDIDVTGERTVQITLGSAVVLKGLVTDAANAGVAEKYVILEGALRFETFSAADGSYALSVPPGVYGLVFHGHRVRPEAAEPMYYLVRTTPALDLQEDTIANLAPPVKQVTVIVQDRAGNPVPGVEITTDGAQTCELTILGLPACGSSSYYSFAGVSQKTDANGQTILWLFPTQADVTGSNAYRLVATPPPNSPFVLFAVNDIAVTGEKTVILSLPFAHDPPVTEANLTPAPGPGGAYLGPVTVTLSATAFGGTTVAQTYYQVDSGAAQTYSAPFQVSGDRTHAVRYWSVDSSGAYETPRTTTFEIVTTIDGLIATLQAASASGGISKPGVVKSFQAKLNAAKSAIARGQSKAAVNALQAFLNELEAQRGKAVLEETYQLLRARTLVVIAGLR